MHSCIVGADSHTHQGNQSTQATQQAPPITMETKHEQLKAFLKTVKVVSKSPCTHQTLSTPKQIYSISEEAMLTFMPLYCDAVKELTTTQGKHLSLTERPTKQGPIVIDLDFRSSNKDPVYTHDDVKTFIAAINELLIDTLDVEVSDMQCYVMENNHVRKNGVEYKSGIHLMYPFICTDAEVMFAIRDEIIKQHQDGILECFQNKDIINTIEDIYDKSVIKSNSWFMYGSGKTNSNPYLLSTIYDYELNQVPLEDVDKHDLPINCSIRKYDETDIVPIKSSSKLFHNIMQQQQPQQQHPQQQLQQQQQIQQQHVDQQMQQYDTGFETSNSIAVDNAKELVLILSKARATPYEDWLNVGFCLHNIDLSLLPTWEQFSKQSKKYKSGECARVWETMKHDGYKMGSLHLWAKMDNPKEYIIFKNKRVKKSLVESLIGGAHYDISKVLYDSYNGQYAFTMSDKCKMWYEFHHHRWETIENGISLRNKIPEELVDQYLRHANELSQKSIQLPEGNANKDKNLKHVELCYKMRHKLRTTTYQNNVMSQCENLFHDQKLLKKLDENKNLMGFNNGTLDITSNEFRAGRPEDFITMSTNINYIPLKEGLKDKDFKRRYHEVDNFLSQIMPEPEMKQYIVDFLASTLWGNVKEEPFPIWEGTGSNGKSLLVQLMEETLGDYKCTLPISILTQKRNASNAASPELAQIQGKRFGVYQEPEPNAVIHVGHMKELTGGDKICARALFQGIREFHPQITQVLTCNKLPKIPSNDGGTWRRIKVVNFGQKFVDNPTKSNEYKIDRTLKEKIKTWVEPFISMLVDRLPHYIEHGLYEPPQVTQHTKQYQQESDVMLEFINENIETTDDENDRLRVGDVYAAFKFWYRENHSDNRMPSKGEMKTHICNTIRPLDKKVWVGLKLTTEGSSGGDFGGGGFGGGSFGGGSFGGNVVNKPKNTITMSLDNM